MLGSARAAAYFGDDVGDLPAFERLAARSTDGSLDCAATVLVTSPETAEKLRAAATDIVAGPHQARGLLVELASLLPED